MTVIVCAPTWLKTCVQVPAPPLESVSESKVTPLSAHETTPWGVEWSAVTVIAKSTLAPMPTVRADGVTWTVVSSALFGDLPGSRRRVPG